MQKILHAKQSILISSLLIISTIIQPFQIPAHEFYFVRHGQTDHNIGLNTNLNDSLNKLGEKQVKQVTSLIAKLPIKTICSSPLLRAQQTTKIINAKLKVPNFIIPELKEASPLVWQELLDATPTKNIPISKNMHDFLHQVKTGLTLSLQQPGPVLIVGHNGIFCGICQILQIKLDHCKIENCALFYFEKNKDGIWNIKTLNV